MLAHPSLLLGDLGFLPQSPRNLTDSDTPSTCPGLEQDRDITNTSSNFSWLQDEKVVGLRKLSTAKSKVKVKGGIDARKSKGDFESGGSNTINSPSSR